VATIEITHPLRLSAQSAEHILRAHEMPVASRYGLDTRWVQRTLHVKRGPVRASICVEDTQLAVAVELPWVFRAMRSQVEEKVRWGLQHYFG
jgi:putative polyhydroxyalkanoate system protein